MLCSNRGAGYAFLAREVLRSRRLMICGGTLRLADDLVYTMNLMQALQVFVYREAQPMFEFNEREVFTVPNPCVVLCDHDVLSARQYISLLVDPRLIIIVVTLNMWDHVPKLYKNSCTCVLECFQSSCFFGNYDDRFCRTLYLQPYDNHLNLETLVVSAQRRFRQRMKCLVVMQRFVKAWLYRPGSAWSQLFVSHCVSHYVSHYVNHYLNHNVNHQTMRTLK